MEYGTGAIFGCPGHDQRDLDFARKYELPVKAVVAPKGQPAPKIGTQAFADTDYTIAVNSGFLDGLDVAAAKRAANEKQDELKAGEGNVTFRSDEHTSELQSLLRISYPVFC